jgi:hypothetical protein
LEEILQETEVKARNGVLKAAGIISILLALSLHIDWLLGYIFGTLISLLMFRLLTITVDEAIGKGFNGARALVFKRYIIRYLIYGVTLYLGMQKSYLNFFTLFVGLFMVKFVIVGEALYKKFKDYLDGLVGTN